MIEAPLIERSPSSRFDEDRDLPFGDHTFQRRSAVHVLVIGALIVGAVWVMNHSINARDIVRGQSSATETSPLESSPPVSLRNLLDPFVIARCCPQALLTVLGIVVGFYLLLRMKSASRIERSFLAALDAPISRGGSRGPHSTRWIVLGLATVTVALIILESMQSYYFVQDDNFANVLPVILHGCRTVFRGEFPDFDPGQLMGISPAGEGFYTLLYPPTLISYAIARWCLGNENYTLEVFAAMHLLAGYLASFAAARTVGLRPALAYIFGISFVLSGYILLVGRGWHSVLTIVVWMPILFCCVEDWLNGRTGLRWMLKSGVAIGGFYYAGFSQYWFYGLMLLAIGAIVAVMCGRTTVRNLVWPIGAGLLGLALLMPLLIVQLEVTRGMSEKAANYGMGIEQGLLAMLVPFPLARADGFMEIHANGETALETQWYYAGTFLMAFAYLGLGGMLAYRCSREWLGKHPWTIAAILSLWLSLGNEGILWTLVGRLPLIRAINHHPHRLLPFFVFFAFIVGGLLLEGLLRRVTNRKWEYALAGATTVLLLYHVSLARTALWSYGDRPYPQLPAEIAQRVLPAENADAGRVWWYGPARTGLPHFAYSLPMSLPSAYGAYGFLGYDSITQARPETEKSMDRFGASPVEASRAYGIRWLLVSNPDYYRKEWEFWWAALKLHWCPGYMNPGPPDSVAKFLHAAQLRYRSKEVDLYELPNVSPMAFDRADPHVPLAIRFNGRGGEVEAPGVGDRKVVVNIATRPWLRASTDGRPLVVSADEWNRLEVQVPDGVSRFDFHYDLPWRRGTLFGSGLGMATLVGFGFIRRRI